MTPPALGRAAAFTAVLLTAVACTAASAGANPSATARSHAARTPGAVRTPAAARQAAASPSPDGSNAAATAGASACPNRRAWATELTVAGRVAWRDSLPTSTQQQGIVLQPLAVGRVGVFAEENAVYGIALANGRKLWRHAFSTDVDSLAGAVYGLWPAAPGTVVVLTGQVTTDARLTELHPATGAVGWTLRLPRQGLLGSQALAAGHTLAVLLPNGTLEAVNLVTGRVLWSRRVGQSAGPAAIGPVIASGGDSRAVGYRTTSGRALWTARALPPQTNLTAADGLFLAWSNTESGNSPTAITALNPRTGRVGWRFNPGPIVSILGAGPAGVVFASYTPSRLYLVNPATGRIRWSISGATPPSPAVAPLTNLIVTGTQVSYATTVTTVGGRSRLVARSAATGRLQWSALLPAGDQGGNLVLLPLPSGPAVATEIWLGTGQSTRLTLTRLATGRPVGAATLPNLVMAPPTMAGTRILAQSDSPACATPAVILRSPSRA